MTEDKTIHERLRRLSQIASNNQDRIREGKQAYLQDLQEIAAGCGNLARELAQASRELTEGESMKPSSGNTNINDIEECGECGSSQIFYESPEYEGSIMTERITCEECGAEYEQTWRLENRRLLQETREGQPRVNKA